MCDLIEYIWDKFSKPFYDTRFRIAFVIFVISSSFGIYYQALNPDNQLGFWDSFTPGSLFSYTVPLLATAIMDGILKAFSYHEELVSSEQNVEQFITALLFGFLMLLVVFVVIATSLWRDDVLLALLGSVFAIVLWVVVNSSNFCSQIIKGFDPTGNKAPTLNNLENGD
jgi:hypothetical protein